MNSKLVSLSIIAGFALFSFICVQVQGVEINPNAISYQSASSLKSELSRIDSKIKYNDRKITTIKKSHNLSDNEKQRKIRSLESENYYLKRKVSKIKSEYRRAVS